MVWNCQGARSFLKVPHLKEESKLLSPNLIFFCGTKNKNEYMKKIKKSLQFDNIFVVEALNKAGEMALLWNNEIKKIEIQTSSFTIKVQIEDQEANDK